MQDGELLAQDQDLRSLLRLVTPGQLKPRGDSRDQEKHDRRHMMGDHHGRAAERASPLVRATDEIFGTHRLLGTQPRAGFEVLDSAPAQSLTLAGRHRFARYMLTFELTDAVGAATHLRAQTRALFPGARQAYRTLVIGTRAHTATTTHILRSARRLSLAPA